MMTFSQQNKLAHSMGAFYEMGFWRFPSVDAKQRFERQVAGLEWTPDQRAVADAALKEKREALVPKDEDVEPDWPDEACFTDLQGNFYDEHGEKL